MRVESCIRSRGMTLSHASCFLCANSCAICRTLALRVSLNARTDGTRVSRKWRICTFLSCASSTSTRTRLRRSKASMGEAYRMYHQCRDDRGAVDTSMHSVESWDDLCCRPHKRLWVDDRPRSHGDRLSKLRLAGLVVQTEDACRMPSGRHEKRLTLVSLGVHQTKQSVTMGWGDAT